MLQWLIKMRYSAAQVGALHCIDWWETLQATAVGDLYSSLQAMATNLPTLPLVLNLMASWLSFSCQRVFVIITHGQDKKTKRDSSLAERRIIVHNLYVQDMQEGVRCVNSILWAGAYAFRPWPDEATGQRNNNMNKKKKEKKKVPTCRFAHCP